MSVQAKSRWADEGEDAVYEARRKRERDEKKRAKAEKQRAVEAEAETERLRREAERAIAATPDNIGSTRPPKKRKLSHEQADGDQPKDDEAYLLHFPLDQWGLCRHVDNFEKLNHIEEGSYGWVSRAKESASGEIVALKKLKMDNAPDGFPVTGLREIQTLMAARHPNIVNLREVVMGDSMNE